jgi:flavin-binding protein dodecin
LETASKSLEDLRIAEVVKQDVTVENGKVVNYRVRLNISFKYKTEK